MTTDFDVIICGAGPAGCTAALALGSSGLKVALIEKEYFPREKVCGDAIPAYVPKVLNTINQEYTIAFESLADKIAVNKYRIISPDKHVLDLNFPEKGFICKRKIFDLFLFELAGNLQNVSLFQGKPAKDVSVTPDNVLVIIGDNIHLKAQVVIGCDGANSIIRKKLADDRVGLGDFSISVRAYFINIKDAYPGTLEFHFLENLLPGYFWIFPMQENQYNVGLGMPSKIISQRKINLGKELIQIIKTAKGISPRFSESEMTSDIKGHLLPQYSRNMQLSGNRFMFCGDAASLVNPATGAGIGHAMQSGRDAGWQVIKCFEKNDFSADFLKKYDKSVYEKIWNENRRYKIIQKFVLKFEWRLNTLIRIGSANKSFQKIIINHLV